MSSNRAGKVLGMKKTQIKRIRLLQRRGLLYAFLLCVFLMLLGGLGFWILEPHTPTFADGMWLAFTTAATVGYGDIVPSTHASRAFAIVMVFFGLSVLSVVTATVAAFFIEAEEKQVERDLLHEIGLLHDLVSHLRDEVREIKVSQSERHS